MQQLITAHSFVYGGKVDVSIKNNAICQIKHDVDEACELDITQASSEKTKNGDK